MKAYIIGLESDPDVGNEIVFAVNGKEAREVANGLDITDHKESYIDVTVRRCSQFDDMEKLTRKELMKEQWREGWWFFQDGCPREDESTDDDFYRWYEEKLGNGD